MRYALATAPLSTIPLLVLILAVVASTIQLLRVAQITGTATASKTPTNQISAVVLRNGKFLAHLSLPQQVDNGKVVVPIWYSLCY